MQRFGVLTPASDGLAGPTEPPGSSDVRTDDGAGYWHTFRWRAMGSTVELVVGGATDAEALAAWAMDEIERLEQCWSRFRADSELMRLNDRSGEWVDVSPTLAEALRSATQWWRDTGGAFDPTVIEALERWGYSKDFALVRAVEAHGEPAGGQAASAAVPGLTGMVSMHDFQTVRLPRGVRLDLGGIGKGLAADLVAEALVDRGASSVLVSMGGDLRAAGLAPLGGYPVPVQNPFDRAAVLFTHPLLEGALVTSTTRIRRWTRHGTAAHHLIDPTTGCPAGHGLAAVILAAPSCAQAEVLAKSVLVSGNVNTTGPAFRGALGWVVGDDGQRWDWPLEPDHGALAA